MRGPVVRVSRGGWGGGVSVQSASASASACTTAVVLLASWRGLQEASTPINPLLPTFNLNPHPSLRTSSWPSRGQHVSSQWMMCFGIYLIDTP